MRNILFFAADPALTGHLLDTACDFAGAVPAFQLAFAPDARRLEHPASMSRPLLRQSREARRSARSPAKW